jgi:hypothetical protein
VNHWLVILLISVSVVSTASHSVAMVSFASSYYVCAVVFAVVAATLAIYFLARLARLVTLANNVSFICKKESSASFLLSV